MNDFIKDFGKRVAAFGFDETMTLVKTQDDRLEVWGGDWAETPFIIGTLSELATAFAALSAMFREADEIDLYEMSEHLSDSGAWLGPDGE